MQPKIKIHKLLTCFFLLTFMGSELATTSASAAPGNIRLGKIKSAGCKRCHGENGMSNSLTTPNLAGQKKLYLIKALKDYKNGKRDNPSMTSVTTWLSDSNIKDIATYYSSIELELKLK